jgi:subtilase family serine protease
MAAGSSATIVFSVDTGNPVTVLDTATVDPHNTIAEPNEGNNTVTIACTEPGPPC